MKDGRYSHLSRRLLAGGKVGETALLAVMGIEVTAIPGTKVGIIVSLKYNKSQTDHDILPLDVMVIDKVCVRALATN
jgi:hypothetical protein